ncbi:MAG: hypothetical protein N5P05_001091 [Chroococcopsis gigantea SAG 12.99]|jgi:hypothetical protein|nr:DUF1194 domain-containing protein [Chlorogloea purpurea SAG 13.99]MDV2999485.1 hypothetical protein [Chroococcopsis gigantea SAG 12.99]
MKSKFFLKSILATGIVGATTLVPVSALLAASVEIGFLIDGSGSVSPSDFALQKDAYVNLFSNNFATNFLSGDVDTLYASFWQFSSNVVEEVGFTTIDSDATALAFANLINANTTQLSGGTDTAEGINTVANALLTNGITADRQVIDLSSDGIPNSQSDALTAATNALANGIKTNTLFVGTDPTGQANLADIAAAGGGTAFIANNFIQYENTLKVKLESDIGPRPTTPEPASILGLLTVSVLGLGVKGAKKAKNLVK